MANGDGGQNPVPEQPTEEAVLGQGTGAGTAAAPALEVRTEGGQNPIPEQPKADEA